MEIKKRLEELQKEFDQLKKEKETLIEQGRQLQAKLNEIDNQLVRKQGAFEEFNKMLPKKEFTK